MGVVLDAPFAANGVGPPEATIRSTLRRTRSAASSGRRSGVCSAKRYSMVIFFPSVHPSLLSSCRNASTRTALPEAVLLSRKPMRGPFVCCCASTEPHSAKSMVKRVRTVIFLFIFFAALSFDTPHSPLFSVAVGTALTSGPPHGSVREGLPHTALTSGSYDGQPFRWDTACRTRHNPCDSLPRLCVRHECACGAFPLVDLLPSADSAANAPALALFARFTGTMRPSDSLQTCMSTLRPLAFFDRPTLPSRVGVCRVSRFSRMELPHVPRVSDSAVPKDRSRLTLPFMLPSPYQDKVGTPKW